jgi:carboxymethylenebutenolidase
VGEIKTYPGAPHAFFRDNDPSVYRSEAAKDAWARTKAFFKKHLG